MTHNGTADANSRLGAQFDLTDFHATVLETGAVPLSDLQWHVDQAIEVRRRRAQ